VMELEVSEKDVLTAIGRTQVKAMD
jgi:hypothetical protein